MMNDSFLRDIHHTLSPLAPIPTGMASRPDPPPGIRAVLFDVYGTLLISGTGDISLASLQNESFGIDVMLSQSGFLLTTSPPSSMIPKLLEQSIASRHEELRKNGMDYPEVEIRNIWSKVLFQLWEQGYLNNDPRNKDVEPLAFRHELAANPVWPMPGFPQIVTAIADAGYFTGIISNAQFYTPIILEALASSSLEDIGFNLELSSWSYLLERAKPSSQFFQGPLERLAELGVLPQEVLCVGNDMLNDIAAAAKAGCRTCLFAGDQRSLRLREGDSRVKAEPDMVITSLNELKVLIGKGGHHGCEA